MADVMHFDEATHTYTLNGVYVDSVTTILERISSSAYRFVDRGLMDRAAALGTAVHKLIELDISGELDESDLDEQLIPYLKSWRRFIATSGFEPILSEEIVWNTRYCYAGQLDLLGTINGELALIDAKRCAQVPVTAGPQTAGYEIAARERFPELIGKDRKLKRFALQLNTDGTHKLIPFTDANDSRVFLAELTARNFMRQHNLLEKAA